MTKPLIDLGSIYIDPAKHYAYLFRMKRFEELLEKKQMCILEDAGEFTDEDEEELNRLADLVLNYDDCKNIKSERVQNLN